MRFRFTLSHDILGSLEISEPDGWSSAILKLERHEEFHSLIEYFDGSFILYGNNGQVNGGIDFVKEVEQTYGPDETIVVDIDVTFDEVTLSNLFNGQYKIVDLEEMPNNKMRIPIIRDDFWAKFISRKDTPVNLQATTDLDNEPISPVDPIVVNLPSQKIQSKYVGYLDTSNPFFLTTPTPWVVGQYLQLDMTVETLDEIEEKFHIPTGINGFIPVNIFDFEFGGEYLFNLRIESWFRDNFGPTEPTDSIVSWWVKKNDDAPVQFTETNFGTAPYESTVYTFNANLTLAARDRITIYGEIIGALDADDMYFIVSNLTPVTPSGAGSATDTRPTFFEVTGQTIFPDTQTQGFLIHDAAAAILKSYGLGVENPFYSDYLGSSLTSARVYPEDGCAWKYALKKGLQLRGYSLSDKPFFQSFEQWWKGANPILNLGLAYDLEETQVIRVEKKEFFYDDSEGTSVDFSNVREITRKYDNEHIFNKVEIGYARWESEEVSGIDDPQTKKTYADRFKKIGKTITLYSEFIAASLAIEKARRQTILKSSDYKHDNEIFIIALNPDLQEESPDVSPDLLHFTPELDENFSSVTNLLNSDTRYNLKLTPARNFLRWQNYIQGALQPYLGSNFKFTSGEGNYDMTSTMDVNGCSNEDFDGNELNEKGNIPVTSDFIHLPYLYEASIPMEYDEYITIRNNRRKPIGISQTSDGHAAMFIKTLSYKPVKGTCDLLLLAKEYLELSVVADHTPMQECQPLSDACENALTDQLGNILTDELGVCITE